MEKGVDPTRFELEITEGLLLGDDPQTHAALSRLRAIGFNIALDDFGTGYSSLSYLQRYPINKIKIDRSFITNLGVDLEAEAVVTAIVKLARALGLSVIAEGVETEEQRARLNFVGCTDVQGYLFGKAVPASDITRMIAKPSDLREVTAA
jgi:EAL domain-containing protein (putative c-di-GMP-specific phosphodiesterase class I)